jgi:hypothetical protein
MDVPLVCTIVKTIEWVGPPYSLLIDQNIAIG